MTTKKNLKNYSLMGAVESGDFEGVHQSLKQGADPNYAPKWVDKSLLHLALKKFHVKIIDLLFQYEAKVNDDFIKKIFYNDYHHISKDLVAIILKYKRDITLMQKIFNELVVSYSKDVEILELLLYHGLPINNFIGKINLEGLTPLHSSIKNGSTEFVSLLLKRKADIHKKTESLDSCLCLAVIRDDKPMVKLLLKNGANINETGRNRQTVLYKARSKKVIRVLLEHGANVNVLDDNGKTPLSETLDFEKQYELVKELAKLKFDNQEINPINSMHLEEDTNSKLNFYSCLTELLTLKDSEVYNGLSLHDVLKMRRNMKKMTLLTAKVDFLEALESSEYLTKYVQYGKELHRIFEEAKNKRDIIEIEKEKMYESGLAKAHSLPPEIMDMIVDFAVNHIYFERGWVVPGEPDTDSESEDEDLEDWGPVDDYDGFNISEPDGYGWGYDPYDYL